jgi:hypothetical protein
MKRMREGISSLTHRIRPIARSGRQTGNEERKDRHTLVAAREKASLSAAYMASDNSPRFSTANFLPK